MKETTYYKDWSLLMNTTLLSARIAKTSHNHLFLWRIEAQLVKRGPTKLLFEKLNDNSCKSLAEC